MKSYRKVHIEEVPKARQNPTRPNRHQALYAQTRMIWIEVTDFSYTSLRTLGRGQGHSDDIPACGSHRRDPLHALRIYSAQAYQEFKDLFAKESFNELLDHKTWDHAIKNHTRCSNVSTKVYPLAPVEQKQLDEFLEEEP